MLRIILLISFLYTSLLFSKTLYSLETSLEHFTSKTHAYVYNKEYTEKISELIWEAQDVPLLKIDFTAIEKGYFFNINYSKNLSNKDGEMNDYDWLKDTTSKWSDWSYHPNTKVKNIDIRDIQIGQYSYIKPMDALFKTTFGYKKMKKSFEAHGGSYVYSSFSGFRDEIGTINGLAISYEEEYSYPYISFDIFKSFDRLETMIGVQYSPKVKITNIDHHHLSYFIDTADFENTSMYGMNLSIEYKIIRNFFIGLDGNFEKYKRVKGDRIRDWYKQGNTSSNATPVIKSSNYSYSNIKFKYIF